MEENDRLIAEICKHLDGETQAGVMRMSVEMDTRKTGKEVSHKCCNVYGKSANEVVGLLDSYTDRNAGRPDNEARESGAQGCRKKACGAGRGKPRQNNKGTGKVGDL